MAYHDLATGDELLIHADATFHAASTMKVPVLMEVFRQAEEKTLSLDDRIAVKIEFASIVDGKPFVLKADDDSELGLYRRLGERITIRELARLMITESSNVATNLLIERVTAARTSELMDRLGAKDVRVLRGVEDGRAYARGMNNTTTARGLMRILLRLAERDVVSEESLRGDDRHPARPEVRRGHPRRAARGSHGRAQDGLVQRDPWGLSRRGDRRAAAAEAVRPGRPDPRDQGGARAHKLVADITRAVYRHAEAARRG